MRSGELIADAARATRRRASRSSLLIVALTIGTAAIVMTLGISQSASAQIAIRINALDARSAVATLSDDPWKRQDSQLLALAGNGHLVREMGTFTIVSSGSLPIQQLVGGQPVTVPIVVATADGLKARGATVVGGSLPAEGLDSRGSNSVILGAAAARQIGVRTDSDMTGLLVNGQRFSLAAIVEDNATNSVLSTAVVLSPFEAAQLGVLPQQQDLAISADAGQLRYLPDFLPQVLDPSKPSSVNISIPGGAGVLKADIAGDTQALVLMIGLATLVMSGFSIATTMQIVIRERHSEIGILRALGMTRVQVGLKFLVESVIVGTAGAGLGWVIGVLASAGVVAFAGWDLFFPLAVWLTPLLGFGVGALGGAVPAIAAARIDPILLIKGEN